MIDLVEGILIEFAERAERAAELAWRELEEGYHFRVTAHAAAIGVTVGGADREWLAETIAADPPKPTKQHVPAPGLTAEEVYSRVWGRRPKQKEVSR